MSAVITPTRYRISVDDFHKMGEAGIFTEDDRIELIEGELIEMAPIGGPHMNVVNKLTRLLVTAVGDQGVVSIQNPVILPPYSEPQPDVTILKPGFDNLAAGVPRGSDVLLLIEVADTALAYDRGRKLPLYAQHGVSEIWIVNIAAKRLEIYGEPGPSGYRRKLELGPGDEVSPAALPGVKIQVDALFA